MPSLHSNDPKHNPETIGQFLKSRLKTVKSVRIAAGYASLRTVMDLALSFPETRFEIVVGSELNHNSGLWTLFYRETWQNDLSKLKLAIETAKKIRRFKHLLENGEIRILYAEPSGKQLHAKLYELDGHHFTGSANLTENGFSGNVELLIPVENPVHSKELSGLLTHWISGGSDMKELILEVLSQSVLGDPEDAEFLWIKAIMDLLGDLLPPEKLLDLNLTSYQREAVLSAMVQLKELGGSIIAYPTGSGKTFIGLALILWFQSLNPGKRVVLIVPPQLFSDWKSILGIYGIFAEVLSIGKIQNRHIIEGEKNILREAGLILVDEAHQFRNERSSRFRLLRSLTDHADKKWVLMTATPINKSPKDLHTLTKFYTNDAKFAKTVKSDSSALSRLKDISLVARPKDLSKQSQNLNLGLEIGQQSFDYADLQVQEHKRKIETTLKLVLPKIIVRENRTSLIDRVKNGEKILINGKPLNFPDIRIHKQPYTIKNPDSPNLLRDLIVWIENFRWTAVLPEVYLKDEELSKMLENTAKLKGKEHFKKLARHPLIYRAILQKNQIGQSLLMLKRMESSLDAFRATFGRLKEKYEKVNTYFAKHGRIPKISTKEFSMDDTEALMNEDVTQIRNVKENGHRGWKTSQFQDQFLQDFMKDYQSILELELILKKMESNKYQVASDLIGKYVSGGHKVLVFTQFTDTLSGLRHFLQKQNLPWFERLETVSSDTGNISGIVERFCPDSAKKGNQVRSNDHPVEVLITTDVLSEGQNLQDCDVMVNFDFCWTPLVLLQRFGRINRVNSRHSMNYLIHLLPSAELDDMLNLMTRLKTRFDAISFTIGGDVNLIDEEFNAEKTRSFLNASGKEGLSWEPDWANFQDPMIKLHHRKDLFINGNRSVEARLRSIPDKSYSVVKGEFMAVFAAFRIGQEVRWKWWREGLNKESESVLEIYKQVEQFIGRGTVFDESDILDALESGFKVIEKWKNQLHRPADWKLKTDETLFYEPAIDQNSDKADDQVTPTLLQWIMAIP